MPGLRYKIYPMALTVTSKNRVRQYQETPQRSRQLVFIFSSLISPKLWCWHQNAQASLRIWKEGSLKVLVWNQIKKKKKKISWQIPGHDALRVEKANTQSSNLLSRLDECRQENWTAQKKKKQVRRVFPSSGFCWFNSGVLPALSSLLSVSIYDSNIFTVFPTLQDKLLCKTHL